MSALVLPETSEWRTVELEDYNPMSEASVSGSSKQQQNNISTMLISDLYSQMFQHSIAVFIYSSLVSFAQGVATSGHMPLPSL